MSMTEVQNWTSAALFISEDTWENWCFWRNPLLYPELQTIVEGKDLTPLAPKGTYLHYISCRWEAITYTEKKMKFGKACSFSELLFPSEMKLQNCPIIVLFTLQTVPLRLGIMRLRDWSCSESWTVHVYVMLYCQNALLGGVPTCVSLLAYTFPSGVRRAL